MGRPPSNGGPSFRFNQAEIAEMEAILQAHKTAMPVREVLVSLAEKFSNSEERSGKIEVQMKQVWNWFQNRRYAIRAKAAKSPAKLNVTQMTRDDSAVVKGVPQATQPHASSSATIRSLPQAPQHPTGPSAVVRTFQQAPQHPAAFSVQSAGRVVDNSQMEYEAKSARDGAWYDVSTFLSHRSLETGDPEVLVRFAGFGAEEDEWVNVRKNVRQRSLPCESSECVAVLPADLILCFQEGKEQALYFDAHVLDAQRRRHDVRGCRCRFLVRYDHDQSEEIVALRKICRRPETDYRLQQLHAVNESLSANHNKNGANNIHTVSTLRVYPPAEVQPKQHKVEPVVPSLPAEVPQKRQKVDSPFPAPPPDGSQKQLKVEPVVVAPPGVPQNQQRVQPSNKVEPMLLVPSAQPLVEPHKVEPMVPCLEPKKVEPVVPVSSAQDSAIVPTCSDKVSPELHEVPVMHDPSTKVPVVGPIESKVAKPQKEPVVSTLVEVPSELPEVPPMMPGSSPELSVVAPMEPKVAETQKEPLVSCTSANLPSELHKVQPAMPGPSSQVSVIAPIEPKVAEPRKEPVVSGVSVEVSSEFHEVQPVMPCPSANSVVAPLESKLAEPQKESVVSGTSVEVPSELHKVHPMRLGPSTDVSLADEPQKEPVVSGVSVEIPSELHKVQPVMDVPLTEASVAAPILPTIAEPQTEEPVVSGTSVEVPPELHEVQPVMPGSSTEVSMVAPVEPNKAEPQKEPLVSDGLAEVPSELQDLQPMMHDPSTKASVVAPVEPKLAEPQTEPVVSELHEVQNAEPDETHTSGLESIATRAEESVNMGEETETKTEEPHEPVLAIDSNVTEAEILHPKLSEIMEGRVDDKEHAEVAENASGNEVGNVDLPLENAGVGSDTGAGTDTVVMEEG